MSEWIKIRGELFKKEDFVRAHIVTEYGKNNVDVVLVILFTDGTTHGLHIGSTTDKKTPRYREFFAVAESLINDIEKQLTYESGTKESEV